MENEYLPKHAGKKNTAEAVFFQSGDCYQKPLAFKRPLLTTLPLHDAVAVELPMIAALIWAAVAPGLCALYKAAAPVTCGVAIEVPL